MIDALDRYVSVTKVRRFSQVGLNKPTHITQFDLKRPIFDFYQGRKKIYLKSSLSVRR